MYAHLLTGTKFSIPSIEVLEYMDANYPRLLSIAQQESLSPLLQSVCPVLPFIVSPISFFLITPCCLSFILSPKQELKSCISSWQSSTIVYCEVYFLSEELPPLSSQTASFIGEKQQIHKSEGFLPTKQVRSISDCICGFSVHIVFEQMQLTMQCLCWVSLSIPFTKSISHRPLYLTAPEVFHLSPIPASFQDLSQSCWSRFYVSLKEGTKLIGLFTDISWLRCKIISQTIEMHFNIAKHTLETMSYNTVCFASSLSSDDIKLR